jgi:hypothetical protein
MEYGGVQVRKLNSPINVRFDIGQQMVHFRIPKTFIIVVSSCTTISDNPFICYLVTREKHGLERNDFLDCMMELRRASKDEAQGDVQSAENANTGATFSKLQLSVLTDGERTLHSIVFGLCCLVHNGPEIGRGILEFITAIF